MLPCCLVAAALSVMLGHLPPQWTRVRLDAVLTSTAFGRGGSCRLFYIYVHVAPHGLRLVLDQISDVWAKAV